MHLATYESDCSHCGGRIEVGDPMVKPGRTFVHEDCTPKLSLTVSNAKLTFPTTPLKADQLQTTALVHLARKNPVALTRLRARRCLAEAYERESDGEPQHEFQPTVEQRALLEYEAQEGKVVRVDALAGCGKTETAQLLTKLLLDKDEKIDIKYIVFNKNAKSEAQARSDSRVSVATAHSIALQAQIIATKQFFAVQKQAPTAKLLRQHLNLDVRANQLLGPDNKEETKAERSPTSSLPWSCGPWRASVTVPTRRCENRMPGCGATCWVYVCVWVKRMFVCYGRTWSAGPRGSTTTTWQFWTITKRPQTASTRRTTAT